MKNPDDQFWMAEALKLARKGDGRVSPNPLVGALVIQKNRVVGKGYHAYFGGPHAEALALQKAGKRARGGTLYVSLEPCSSWGKTPPCVDSVISSGVRRVVIGSLDPNPQNNRVGVRKLKRAGIEVERDVLCGQIEKQNEAFFKRMRSGFPFVTLKMAQSLDGKIATRSGESRWISSGPARELVHRLRSEADAVLVGKNTALQDNPRLRGLKMGEKPWRVVLDPFLELSSRSRIFQGPQLTLVVASEKKLKQKTVLAGPQGRGSRIIIPVPEVNGRLELKFLFRQLAQLGVNHLLVEGGGEVAWSLLQEKRVDRLIWIVAPKIIGGRNALTSVEGEGIEKLKKAIHLTWEKVYSLGHDWVFEAGLCSRESSNHKLS